MLCLRHRFNQLIGDVPREGTNSILHEDVLVRTNNADRITAIQTRLNMQERLLAATKIKIW